MMVKDCGYVQSSSMLFHFKDEDDDQDSIVNLIMGFPDP